MVAQRDLAEEKRCWFQGGQGLRLRLGRVRLELLSAEESFKVFLHIFVYS